MMNLAFADYLILLLAIGGLAIGFIMRSRQKAGSLSFIWFAVGMIIWKVTNLLTQSNGLSIYPYNVGVSFLGKAIVVTALLFFVTEYVHPNYWQGRSPKHLLFITPVIIQSLLWATLIARNKFPDTHLYWLGDSTILYLFNWIDYIYTNTLLVLALIIISKKIRIQTPFSNTPALSIFVSIMAPLLFTILIGSELIEQASNALIGFAFSEAILAYVLFAPQNVELSPITCNIALEKNIDGWMLIDRDLNVVYLNPLAEQIIGLPRNIIIGQPAEKIFHQTPNIASKIGDMGESEIKGSIELLGRIRFFNIRLIPVLSEGIYLGQIITWRDITERRKADEARQQARDEMFSLLHSLSGAASRSENMEDFLSASLYQLVYSFKSQTGFIFLYHEKQLRQDRNRLILIANYGVPENYVDNMAVVHDDDHLVQWLENNRIPLVLDNVSSDDRIHPTMRSSIKGSLAFIPMVTDNDFTGVICLGREEGKFEPDEVTRLSIAAEQISNFVYNDRRKQMALAVAERNRLVRDLHDSISQKLYGVVTLTEAAQAGAEAGVYNLPDDLIVRLGENARQALKEMRLFLHEMQPVHLEQDGLVSVLHQRLNAVEGRANVRTRFISDDKIPLDLEKEVALYYIAQEALNNILKHANATSVEVFLKRGRSLITLEVIDNGQGFDPKNVSNAGLGLQNMRERAALVNGKLKITSSHGKGTKVSVFVKMDKSQSPQKKRRQRKK